MKQIPLTKGQYALVDDEDYEFLMQWKWHYTVKGYAARSVRLDSVNGKQRCQTIYMHTVLLNTPKGRHTDHKDGNRLNNSRANIRVCTASENHCNRQPLTGCSSEYKGVSWHSRHKKWRAKIATNGRSFHLGYFDDEASAATAYNIAALQQHKEFARINTL